MVEAPTPPPGSARPGILPSAPRSRGWVGAWVAVAVLAGWHCGFGGRSLAIERIPSEHLVWPADAALLATLTLLSLAAGVRSARRGRGRRGSEVAELASFVPWFALAVWAGFRGASAAGDRAGSPIPEGRSDWIVRVESIDWSQDPPVWTGRAFAWVAEGSWVPPRRPLALRGAWPQCETGGFLLRGRATVPAGGERARLQVERAFRLTGRPGAGRGGPNAARARARSALAARVRRGCGPEAGELAVRTLLGPSAPPAPSFTRPFRETGTMHLLSISGFHLTLIGGILWTTLRALAGGAPWSKWPALAGLGAYAWFVGGPTPVQRAFGVALLLACGRGWGRARRLWNALGWMAALLPLLEPEAPASASFRLSFAAMAGVVWGGAFASARRAPTPGRVRARRRLPCRSAARGAFQVLCASMGAGLLTAPWSFHHFGVVYPLGTLANLVAIPAMAVTLAVQGIAVLALAAGAGDSFPLVVAGRVAGESFLSGLRWLAEGSGRWAWVGGCGLLAALAWTLALALVLRAAAQRRPPRGPTLRWIGIAAVPALAALAIDRWRERATTAAPLELSVLDVGQGDAALLRLGARRWLVDLGLGSRTGRRDRLVPALCRRGVRRLERVWVTHGDGDHWGGLGDLLASPVRVDTVALPAGAPFPPAFWETLARSPQRPVVLRESAGWERTLRDGVRARVLHPPCHEELRGRSLPRGSNGWSLAMLLETRAAPAGWRARALLSGDLERDREGELLRQWGPGRPVAVALLAHHGSRTAGSEDWWARARPGLVLISAGRGNPYGLPHAETLEAARRHGARWRRTDENGAVRCAFDARGVRVRTERPPCPRSPPVL